MENFRKEVTSFKVYLKGGIFNDEAKRNHNYSTYRKS